MEVRALPDRPPGGKKPGQMFEAMPGLHKDEVNQADKNCPTACRFDKVEN